MSGDEYRATGSEFLISARQPGEPQKTVLKDLGSHYLRLAEAADEGRATDLAGKLAA
jgi:hypothetical protein